MVGGHFAGSRQDEAAVVDAGLEEAQALMVRRARGRGRARRGGPEGARRPWSTRGEAAAGAPDGARWGRRVTVRGSRPRRTTRRRRKL